MGGMLDAPREGDWGARLDPAYADLVAGKFQNVRIPVRWSNHASLDADALIDPFFLKRVTSAVDLFLAKGMYVVLDVHQYQQLMGENLNPNEFRVNDAVVDARFINIWRELSDHFKYYPDKLLFKLLNEPSGRITHDVWNATIPKLLAVVREKNPTRVVVVGPAEGNYLKALPKLKLPPDPNVILTVHTYDPFRFTHQGANWIPLDLPRVVTSCDAKQRSQITEGLDIAKDWGAKFGRPIYLGEFGIYLPKSHEWVPKMLPALID